MIAKLNRGAVLGFVRASNVGVWSAAGILLMFGLGGYAADDALRERLTEREDKRRPPQPTHFDLGGRPLTLSGEYEIGLDTRRRRVIGGTPRERDRRLVEQGLEAEAFYSFGAPLSLFAQALVNSESDKLARGNSRSDNFAERGEMWLFSENIRGSGISLDAGRLNFEDDRRWWWDGELDAVRVAYDGSRVGLDLAYAREFGPTRSDRGEIAAEEQGVHRVLGELSWDWSAGHAAELFFLQQSDRSTAGRIGQTLRRTREDDSDAKLTWLGLRFIGAFDGGSHGILGYWADAARVRGTERSIEYEDESATHSTVTEVSKRKVRGWALDVGVNWLLPMSWEPRLFVGYALGSGDATPDSGDDRTFRQSGLHANESGFGGVRRFAHYGVALEPELSNLRVFTLGAGCALLKSSSLDIVYHRYRLAERAGSLRGTALEFTLTGLDQDVGDGLDVVLGLEEWERFEFEFTVSAFRAGRAFGVDEGSKSYRGLISMRVAF